MTICPAAIRAAVCALAFSATAASAQSFTFTVNEQNNTFTYTDAQRTVTGIFVKPAGTGPFPAVIINHGQGSNPSDYSLAKANEMVAWGLVCIGPQLTHSATEGDFSGAGSGNSPENIARGQACLAGLGSLGYVDLTRVAVWGHSKGSYAAIGQVAAMGTSIRAAGLSAGGCTIGGNGATQAIPTDAEADPVVSPFTMFVGSLDSQAVTLSLNFKGVLDGNSVANDRTVYNNVGHNVHQDAAANADMLAKFQAWLTTHGVLVTVTTSTFTSIVADDGYTSNTTSATAGGTDGSSIRAGEGASTVQYRGFLSFDTSALPDGATIVSAKLRLKQGAEVGTPFSTLGACTVDIKNGFFGAAAGLAGTDATAAASATNVATVPDGTNGAWTEVTLSSTAFAHINQTGKTQFRLQFPGSGLSNHYIGFYSGNSASADRPQLVIEHQ